jgi:uncharacterized protein
MGQPRRSERAVSRSAKSVYQDLRTSGTRIITTNYIIAELTALLTSPLRLSRTRIIALVEGVKSSELVKLVHIDKTLDDEAWRLLKDRPDKAWSLVDCSSFVVMKEQGITEALTNDHNFEQAGLIRLLK